MRLGWPLVIGPGRFTRAARRCQGLTTLKRRAHEPCECGCARGVLRAVRARRPWHGPGGRLFRTPPGERGHDCCARSPIHRCRTRSATLARAAVRVHGSARSTSDRTDAARSRLDRRLHLYRRLARCGRLSVRAPLARRAQRANGRGLFEADAKLRGRLAGGARRPSFLRPVAAERARTKPWSRDRPRPPQRDSFRQSPTPPPPPPRPLRSRPIPCARCRSESMVPCRTANTEVRPTTSARTPVSTASTAIHRITSSVLNPRVSAFMRQSCRAVTVKATLSCATASRL